MILAGCSKDPCVIETTVPVEFACENAEILKYISIHFMQGQRVVLADVVHGADFKEGKFKWIYKFYDTDPDLMVWTVYQVDRSGWVQYETKIK